MIIRVAVLFFSLLVQNSIAQSIWNSWSDANSVKRILSIAQDSGKTYFSQFDYYPPRKADKMNSRYVDELGIHPLIYGLDFYYASGTWFPRERISVVRENLISIVKKAWKQNKAIPCFSWHLENPYVPSSFSGKMGCRYRYGKENYPKEHRYVVNEILNNTGDKCGFGNLSGIDNEDWFDNPLSWFVERCREIASILNELVDDDGSAIPCIFRPWHENDGNWMWWGRNVVSEDDYKRFFVLTETLVKKFAPNSQILWAYSPDRYYKNENEFMSRYPGDEYIDLIGYDDYSIGKVELEESLRRARMVSEIARKRGKILALFETDNKHEKTRNVFFKEYLSKLLVDKEVHFSVVQLWSVGKFDSRADVEDRKNFLALPNIIKAQ